MPTQTFFDLKEEKKNRILDAARRVFIRDTYDKISIQDIIKEAKIPRGSFYQYFEDKDDLFLYCLQEIYRKSLSIIYQDNMDYYWNVLYNEHPEKKAEMPWEIVAIEQMKQVLTEDEFNFAMKIPLPKGHILGSAYSDEAKIFYPLILKYLEASNTISDPEKLDLVAFMFSCGDLLSHEYAHIKGVSPNESFLHTRVAIRAVYEAFRDKSAKDSFNQLQSLLSLHLLSSDGLDITITLTPGQHWIIENTDNLIRREISIMSNNLRGHLLIDAHSVQTCVQNTTDTLIITTDPQSNAACSLNLGGRVYNLGKNLTVLGTTRDGAHICIIDIGKYLL